MDLWQELLAADYDIGIYTDPRYLDDDVVAIAGNVREGTRIIGDPWGLAGQMMKFTAFTYLPHFLKRAFEFYTYDF